MKVCIAMLVVAAAACTNASSEGSLGITDYEVQRHAHGVTIIGRDAQRATIGEVALTHGRFRMSDDGREVDGRRMSVTVLGENVTHESEGYLVLALPMLPPSERNDAINAFLREEEVAGTLVQWGVGINPNDTIAAGAREVAPPADLAEQPASSCSYPGCSMSSTHSCKMTENAEAYPDFTCTSVWDEVRCCSKIGATGGFAYRRCSGGNSCGPPGNNGAGCAVCWQTTWRNHCSTWVSGGQWQECYDGWNTISYYFENIGYTYD